jgi:hypothetical protein
MTGKDDSNELSKRGPAFSVLVPESVLHTIRFVKAYEMERGHASVLLKGLVAYYSLARSKRKPADDLLRKWMEADLSFEYFRDQIFKAD